jgi:hypothetical protein
VLAPECSVVGGLREVAKNTRPLKQGPVADDVGVYQNVVELGGHDVSEHGYDQAGL